MSILDTCGLFVFIGAKPATEWLGGQIAVDKHGFVLTGPDLPQDIVRKLDRPPLLLERCRGPIASIPRGPGSPRLVHRVVISAIVAR